MVRNIMHLILIQEKFILQFKTFNPGLALNWPLTAQSRLMHSRPCLQGDRVLPYFFFFFMEIFARQLWLP